MTGINSLCILPVSSISLFVITAGAVRETASDGTSSVHFGCIYISLYNTCTYYCHH
ncbi:hypothetical protein PF005_g25296 [Phytophthora fragariae]|uniref:RxLR effector protein n=1 Tax=Phytophthora fragariae TaxID=53985 RepID=A0A6A3QTV1_9STRA|nr:hypothetical protein PF003_g32735 [Phytophthora fragariae]KAE8929970.1 hypothetical protein PF009_g19919 [Phytophthora fragariae]KAE8969387.1 hypothetical protein PF011_g26825 [Phytophthora fragariae]KAE9073566.1 hypothetical protein PF010_g25016 [Phytophthora fragariae]KAE9082740.1 hypothetical protein PF007_g22182 [Phytophthora fragariae]